MEIIRYGFTDKACIDEIDFYETPNGEYVKFSEHEPVVIENERLRTRCLEMAAEIERVQSVAAITNDTIRLMAEEANAQRPAVFIDNDRTVLFNEDYRGDRNGKFYARPIPAQQSPAVAVQYQSAVSGMWYSNPNAAGEICRVKVNGELFVVDSGSRSPRITEQDAREIISDYLQWKDGEDNPRKATITKWLAEEFEGRATINKLNEAKNAN